jgi:hypothetical protein
VELKDLCVLGVDGVANVDGELDVLVPLPCLGLPVFEPPEIRKDV